LNKIGYLESLRGIAALVVVFAHFVVGFYPALYWARQDLAHFPANREVWISGTPLNLFYNGDFSVAIFFVLSGFVLSYKFFQHRETNVFLLPLILKRYVRLLIPVLFSLVLAYAFLKFSLLSNRAASTVTKSVWMGTYWQFRPDFWDMMQEAFFGVFFRSQHTYNNVLWTMTFEFYGSLIVFVFVAFFRNSPRRFLVYGLAAVLTFRSYYLAFILGILLCDLVSSENSIVKKTKSLPLLVVLLLVGLFLGSYPTERGVEGTVYAFLPGAVRARTWHIAGAFLVMISVLQSRRLQAILSKKPFLFLGRISFSQYILHFLVICSLSCSLLLKLAPVLPYHAAVLATFCISLPVIMAASHFIYLFVDRAGMRWSQAVYGYLLQRRESLQKRGAASTV
jgi:peptidoglycan/LPS O-acetylase OafA/YrhL